MTSQINPTGRVDVAAAAVDYLATRRALGYKLRQQGQLLTDFVAHLNMVGAEHLTTAVAVDWALRPAGADPVWWSAKLDVIRGFARYLRVLDPLTEVPPAGVLPGRDHRIVPYIYRPDEITALVAAAGRLGPTFRARTYQTVIALLAVTGMRRAEAIGLDRSDLDVGQGLLTIRNGKFGKSRQLPLHASSIQALRLYRDQRDQRHPTATTDALFLSTVGTRLICDNATATFNRLVTDSGITWSSRRRRPRLHDLRHSFAVGTLLSWYRAGLDVEPRLPLLSTWLGHIGPATTYWYLTGTPDLLAVIVDRLDTARDGRP